MPPRNQVVTTDGPPDFQLAWEPGTDINSLVGFVRDADTQPTAAGRNAIAWGDDCHADGDESEAGGRECDSGPGLRNSAKGDRVKILAGNRNKSRGQENTMEGGFDNFQDGRRLTSSPENSRCTQRGRDQDLTATGQLNGRNQSLFGRFLCADTDNGLAAGGCQIGGGTGNLNIGIGTTLDTFSSLAVAFTSCVRSQFSVAVGGNLTMNDAAGILGGAILNLGTDNDAIAAGLAALIGHRCRVDGVGGHAYGFLAHAKRPGQITFAGDRGFALPFLGALQRADGQPTHVETTDATPASVPFTGLEENKTYRIKVEVLAHNSTSPGNVATFEKVFVINRKPTRIVHGSVTGGPFLVDDLLNGDQGGFGRVVKVVDGSTLDIDFSDGTPFVDTEVATATTGSGASAALTAAPNTFAATMAGGAGPIAIPKIVAEELGTGPGSVELALSATSFNVDVTGVAATKIQWSVIRDIKVEILG